MFVEVFARVPCRLKQQAQGCLGEFLKPRHLPQAGDTCHPRGPAIDNFLSVVLTVDRNRRVCLDVPFYPVKLMSRSSVSCSPFLSGRLILTFGLMSLNSVPCA